MQNGRVVRQEMKCGNNRSAKIEEAWEIIKIGLLAQRYTILIADSLSSASFYKDDMPTDVNDKKIVD